MKKILVLATLLVTLSFASQAQVAKGDFLLNAGIGLGYYYAGGVPLVVSGEYAFSDVFSAGPYIAYTSWNRGYFGNDFKYKFIDFGVRGSYHFNQLFQLDIEKLDIYGGGFLGFVVSSYTYNGGTITGYDNTYGSGLRGGIHAGARYYFSEKVAGYGELGYGFAPLQIGFTFKL